jgi:aminoglycoside phosphotransferase (APT) family kinase protein
LAVIDFGCCAVGDPACDLVIAWTLLDGPSRSAFRAGLDLDRATWQRAAGWALWKALLIAAGRSAPVARERAALEVIEAVLGDPIAG